MRTQWEKNRLIDVYDKCTRVADFSSELLPHDYINQPSNGPHLHGLSISNMPQNLGFSVLLYF